MQPLPALSIATQNRAQSDAHVLDHLLLIDSNAIARDKIKFLASDEGLAAMGVRTKLTLAKRLEAFNKPCCGCWRAARPVPQGSAQIYGEIEMLKTNLYTKESGDILERDLAEVNASADPKFKKAFRAFGKKVANLPKDKRQREAAFIDAVVRGDADKIRLLAVAGKVNIKTPRVWEGLFENTPMPPLFAAVRRRQTAAVRALVNEGANARESCKGPNGRGTYYPLWLAVGNNSANEIRILAQRSLPRDQLKYSLGRAAEKGYLESLRALVEVARAPLNEGDEEGQTALMKAASAGHLDAVRYLVESGSDVNLYSRISGDSALWVAFREQRWDVAAYLLPLVNEMTLKNHGRSLWLSRDEIPEEFTIQWIRRVFASPSDTVDHVRQIYHELEMQMARVVLRQDFDPRQAFVKALLDNDLPLVRMLVYLVNIDLSKPRSWKGIYGGGELPPLAAAAHMGNIDMVKLLLAAGAYANQVEDLRFSPSWMEEEDFHQNDEDVVVHSLSLAEPPENVTYPRRVEDSIPPFKLVLPFILKLPFRVTPSPSTAKGTDKGLTTALSEATYYNHLAVIDALIAGGASVNTLNNDALRIAARNGYAEAVERLLAAGANPNETSYNLRTPLMEAAMYGHGAIAERLVPITNTNLSGQRRQGSGDKSIPGQTAMDLAWYAGHMDIVTSIVAKGSEETLLDASRRLRYIIDSRNPTYGAVIQAFVVRNFCGPSADEAEIQTATDWMYKKLAVMRPEKASFERFEEIPDEPSSESGPMFDEVEEEQEDLELASEPFNILVTDSSDYRRAIVEGDERSVKLLLLLGDIDINYRFRWPGTVFGNKPQKPVSALYVAARLGNREMVRTLLKFGANVEQAIAGDDPSTLKVLTEEIEAANSVKEVVFHPDPEPKPEPERHIDLTLEHKSAT